MADKWPRYEIWPLAYAPFIARSGETKSSHHRAIELISSRHQDATGDAAKTDAVPLALLMTRILASANRHRIFRRREMRRFTAGRQRLQA